MASGTGRTMRPCEEFFDNLKFLYFFQKICSRCKMPGAFFVLVYRSASNKESAPKVKGGVGH